jgi:hypothetical protein
VCSQCLFTFCSRQPSPTNLRWNSFRRQNRSNLHHHGALTFPSLRPVSMICSSLLVGGCSQPFKSSRQGSTVDRTVRRDPFSLCTDVQSVDIFSRLCHTSTITLVSLLSGARNEQNAPVSQKIVDRMKQIFPEMKAALTAATVLLANTYASTGQYQQASTTRMDINKFGWKKKVGVSTTVVNGQFTVSNNI